MLYVAGVVRKVWCRHKSEYSKEASVVAASLFRFPVVELVGGAVRYIVVFFMLGLHETG